MANGGGDSTSGSGGAGGSTTTATATGGAGGSTTTTATGGAGGSTTTTATGGAGGAGGSTTTGTGGAAPCVTSVDCDDGLYCNGVEVCDAGGVCVPGASPCDDGVACTVASCDEVTDACAHVPSDGLCDDGQFCNGTEVCNPGAGDPQTGCVIGTTPCDDGLSCTVDACDDAMDSCSHAPNDALCGNGIACDGIETCSPILGCLSGTAASCDDGLACTSDFCDPGSGQCAHVPDDKPCQNGVFCDGIEACDPVAGNPVTGCAAGAAVMCDDGIACTNSFCSEATKACVHIAQNNLCNDGAFCNGVETCVFGFGCSAGTPVNCNDGRSCTLDTCSDASAACEHTPNDAVCSDGLDCNGVEQCSEVGPAPSGCVAGMAIPCGDDGIACTVDACDEATNQCVHAASNAACPAGELCVPVSGGCTASPTCQTNAECDDGNACNGSESCNVVCQPGQPLVCDDGIACTDNSCNPATGACSFPINNAACDDGLACNGTETCSAQLGCQAGMPKACSDNVACTMDECVEPLGTCAHAPNDDLCDDNQLCNGAEVCTANGCQSGMPFACPSDGIACTEEICDPVVNACTSVEQDSLCPCGQTCSPAQGGCGSFCTVSTCQGKVYACGDCLDNDGDCEIDSADGQCLGPCDNTEDSFFGGIAGQNNSPCKSDCYFDQDTGSGNDDCYWSHKCDPLEVAPNYSPEGSQCAYNPNASIPGYNGSCATAFMTQSATCGDYCGPLTPNGCDCFGCCAIPGAPTTVWLGSENPSGVGSCNLANLNDPTMCKPCTQVQACLNTCEHCEICIGKPDLPADCAVQECSVPATPCGLPGLPACAVGSTCITGCCQANPE